VTAVLAYEVREYQALARAELTANCRAVLGAGEFDPPIVEQIVAAMVEYLAGEAGAGLPVDVALRACCGAYLESGGVPEPAAREWIVREILGHLDAEARAASN
jgi:hypothetical protein